MSDLLVLAALGAGFWIVSVIHRALESLDRIAAAAELVAREATKRETALERELDALRSTPAPQEPQR